MDLHSLVLSKSITIQMKKLLLQLLILFFMPQNANQMDRQGCYGEGRRSSKPQKVLQCYHKNAQETGAHCLPLFHDLHCMQLKTSRFCFIQNHCCRFLSNQIRKFFLFFHSGPVSDCVTDQNTRRKNHHLQFKFQVKILMMNTCRYHLEALLS